MSKNFSKWALIQGSNEIRQWIKLLGAGAVATAIYFDQHPEKKMKFECWLEDKKSKIKSIFK